MKINLYKYLFGGLSISTDKVEDKIREILPGLLETIEKRVGYMWIRISDDWYPIYKEALFMIKSANYND